MKLFKILKNKKYLSIFIFSSLLFLIIYPVVQVIPTGGVQNIDVWFSAIPKINLLLVTLLSISFGLLLTLQIYNLKVKTCNIKKSSLSASTGGIGAIFAGFVPACPACLSFASLLLPAATAISLGGFLIKFSSILLIISIGLIILGITLLGGFKKI